MVNATSSPSTDRRNRTAVSTAGTRWAAALDAGAIVATMAGAQPCPTDKLARNFPALLREKETWRREQAEAGIADLSAIMEAGLAALLAICARGGDCRAAAQALWQEFLTARASLLELLPPAGALGPLRSA